MGSFISLKIYNYLRYSDKICHVYPQYTKLQNLILYSEKKKNGYKTFDYMLKYVVLSIHEFSHT